MGQNSWKLNVQELQETSNYDEVGVLVLPSVATAGQLLSTNSIHENQINKWKANIKDAIQITAEVEEILLFDPP